MPLAYMNSWASLALRALALVVFAIAHWAAGDGPGGPADLAAASLLLLVSAAHPTSMALRLGSWPGLALMSAAQAAVGLALAAILALGALGIGIGDGAAVAVPLSAGLAVLALADGVAQRRRLRRDHAGGWPPLAIAVASGAAGTALLAAFAADAAVSGAHVAGGGLVAGIALALAGWIMHSALRLRRACRAALRARQRDWALAQPPTAPAPCLRPSTQPG